MFPGNKLSIPAVPAAYFAPDDKLPAPQYSWQLGGIGLSDASQGLQVQDWYLQIVNNSDAVISSATQAPLVLFSVTNLESVSLAFDQNMKAAVAYVSQGNAYLWWYDTTIPGYTIVNLPAGAGAPQATLDDKRNFAIQAGESDIIVSYINTNNLFFRMQRDRFLIEYSLYTNIPGGTGIANPVLQKIGMAENYRMQWRISGTFFGYLYVG